MLGLDSCLFPRRRGGFTLVELLVVIAIIGILVALLLPAVQAAREAARRAQCKNHLKQLALGFILHEDAHKFLPSGGWGYMWMSHPNQGFGLNQPGGWGYTTLPYIEQNAIYDYGSGGDATQVLATNAAVHAMPVKIHYCPSRRQARAYQVKSGVSFVTTPLLSNSVTLAARSDYAANGGENLSDGFVSGPTTLAAGLDGSYAWTEVETGIIANHKLMRFSNITDGTSLCYLIGEKSLNPDMYENGLSLGDDQGVYSGDERDVVRFTNGLKPAQDRKGVDNTWGFGSPHAATFHMAYCDGSVHAVRYNLEDIVHRRLSNKSDGNPVTEE